MAAYLNKCGVLGARFSSEAVVFTYIVYRDRGRLRFLSALRPNSHPWAMKLSLLNLPFAIYHSHVDVSVIVGDCVSRPRVCIRKTLRTLWHILSLAVSTFLLRVTKFNRLCRCDLLYNLTGQQEVSSTCGNGLAYKYQIAKLLWHFHRILSQELKQNKLLLLSTCCSQSICSVIPLKFLSIASLMALGFSLLCWLTWPS